MINQDQITALFKTTGTFMEGHFRLTSGLHSGLYVEKFRLLEHPKHTAVLCQEIARRFRDDGISLVVGPAIGGIIIAYEVARALGVRAIFLEREDGRLQLRRGFVIEPTDRVLVVEDIVTTGGSVKEVLTAVEGAGATIVGVGLLVDRSGGQVDLNYRTEALLTMKVTTYTPEECPLCAQGLPVVKPGSRKA
ncbi:MAG: orotate phosphoribosyltransferase [Selenomonadales bacterium]|nr:orotate phosphoribosyltransferase [Selenomonadales bacterium]